MWQGCVENVYIEGEKKSVEKKKEGESEKTYHVAIEWLNIKGVTAGGD